MDYFTLFGLPVHYQINMQQLMSFFQNLQRQYHPDNFINHTKTEQLTAIKQSATINQAWQTLRNPLTRAEYILFLHGFDCTSAKRTFHDKTFLSEQLNLREEFDNIKQTKDKKKLEIFIQHIKEIFNVQYQKMVKQLNNKQWDEAADTVIKIHFLDKLCSSAEQLEENLLSFDIGSKNDIITK